VPLAQKHPSDSESTGARAADSQPRPYGSTQCNLAAIAMANEARALNSQSGRSLRLPNEGLSEAYRPILYNDAANGLFPPARIHSNITFVKDFRRLWCNPRHGSLGLPYLHDFLHATPNGSKRDTSWPRVGHQSVIRKNNSFREQLYATFRQLWKR
jgi:hypothetical protein